MAHTEKPAAGTAAPVLHRSTPHPDKGPYRVTVGLLVFLGVTALGGGAAMTFAGDGTFPEEWIDLIPLIDGWVLPGLVLAIGFGIGSLVTAYGVVRQPTWAVMRPIEQWTRQHWSWLATSLIGIGQTTWIALELLYLPEISWLQLLYGPLGLALATLPLTTALRNRLAVE